MATFMWFVFICQAMVGALCFQHRPQTAPGGSSNTDTGSALFLTPLIQSGQIAEGWRQARVKLAGFELESYAGFFTVNETYNSNQFLWYFPPVNEASETAPVLLWLQGGPGASSLFGLFVENGPLAVRNESFVRREIHWALNHHLIYIDNPVGTGYSFTDHDQAPIPQNFTTVQIYKIVNLFYGKSYNFVELYTCKVLWDRGQGYCTEETQIGEELHSTLTQFFQLFPELNQNKFFISGESYAGKFVPALGHTILKKNPTAEIKINLQGLAIGGAFCAPRPVPPPISRQYFSGLTFPDDHFDNKIQTPAVRKALHVGDYEYDVNSYKVSDKMVNDFDISVAPWISELLDHFPMVFYNGDKDIIVPVNDTLYFLQHLRFNGSEEYKKAKRTEWRVDGQLAGYVKSALMLTDVLVLNGTHFVPADVPKQAWDLITRLTHGKGF